MSQNQKSEERSGRPQSGSWNPALIDDNRRGSQNLKERYETLQQISEGSTATVWKAVDNKMNELVALKIAHKISTCGNLAIYFRQEAKVLQKMNHPNIIKIHDATSKYVSMELMSTCLFDYILENKNLPIPTILGLFAQIVQSVAHVHSKGYCHRDIKLENILLNRTCATPKLADFGFATKSLKRIDALFPGSPDYLAPEIAWKRPYDGMSYDMWSLGILLYAMASRRFPFSKPSESNDLIVSRIRGFESFEATTSKNQHEFSPEVESLLKRLLLKDPSSRATAQSLLEDPILTPYIIKEEAANPQIKETQKTKSRFASLIERGLSRISLTLADKMTVKSVDTQTQSEKSQVSQTSQ